jgi:peroxiredoxin/mono/diheme cytochrome c family protein
MRRFGSLIGVLLLTVTLVGLSGGAAFRAEREPASTARKVPAFTLKDAADRSWSLSDFRTKKAVVIVFIGTECPINNAYMPRLVELHKTYEPRGVGFLAINANSHDTVTRLAAHTKEYALPFPVLKDPANTVADQFGAQRTPEAFVLDPEGGIMYQGRIDDQFGIGFKRPAPTRRDLVEALEEVLAGKPVSQPRTKVAGCVIARTIKPKAEGTVTYTKHVSRILQKNCQECHRPKQVGPMPLLTYEDALAWAETIREVIEEKRMPPWHADPRFGKFRNDRTLSPEDRTALLSWIDQGCPKGDPKDLPAPRSFAEGWRIGKPDVVFSMKEPFTVPAKVGSEGIKYQIFPVTSGFDEDRWVQAAEARPGNRAVVHHIIVFIVPPGKKRERTPDRIGEGFLVGYAPGDMPAVYAPGTAKKVPKGSLLVFQVHYTPNGVEQDDVSSVGLIFAKEPPRHAARTRSIENRDLEILAGAANHQVKAFTRFDQDVELLSMLPHMHLRGKDFEYRVVFPDGKSQTLLRVPRYDFGWQSNYYLSQPLHLPAGTRIECTAHFDNSAGNPNNPDPKETVYWGEQTWEEMMIGFIDYVYSQGKP